MRSRGTDSAVFLKAVRRLFRDIQSPSSRSSSSYSCRSVYGSILFLLLLFISFILLLRRLTPPFSVTYCYCPLASDLFSRLLSRSDIVILARIPLRIPIRPGALLTLSPHSVLRGPPGLLLHSISLRAGASSACGTVRPGDVVLIAASSVLRTPGGNATNGGDDGQSFVDASSVLGPPTGCPDVWMARWSRVRSLGVPIDTDDSGAGPQWWRARTGALPWGDANDAISVSSSAPQRARPRPPQEWWVRSGVSLIAACKDRSATLSKAAPTWFSVRGVDEIVLVDWGSRIAAELSLHTALRADKRLRVVRVQKVSEWSLSKAYNLAIAISSRANVLKVDCDTALRPTFLEAHRLRRGERAFFAGDWHILGSHARSTLSEQLHVNGLLFAHRADILRTGGYDERLSTYGWDDSDITTRLSARALVHRKFNYSLVRHISHAASLRLHHQASRALLPPSASLAAPVEIQRNRLLLMRFGLPEWCATSPRTVWTFSLPSTFTRNRRIYSAFIAADVPSASELVSAADAEDASKRAIRLVLTQEGLPLLPRSLSLNFYRSLAVKVGAPSRYSQVALALRGGCASRLLAYAAALSEIYRTSPPKHSAGWRMRLYWPFPSAECSCRISDTFLVTNAEIYSTWSDPHLSKARFSAVRTSEPRAFLGASSSASASASGNSSEPVLGELVCAPRPSEVSSARVGALRAALRRIGLPAPDVRMEPRRTVLDHAGLRPSVWEILLGTASANRVQKIFADGELRALAASWNGALGTLTVLDGRGDALQRVRVMKTWERAIVLYVAVKLKNVPGWKLRVERELGPDMAGELEKTVQGIYAKLEKLFEGCPGAFAEYIEMMPEIAVVVAGMFGARVCGS